MKDTFSITIVILNIEILKQHFPNVSLWNMDLVFYIKKGILVYWLAYKLL